MHPFVPCAVRAVVRESFTCSVFLRLQLRAKLLEKRCISKKRKSCKGRKSCEGFKKGGQQEGLRSNKQPVGRDCTLWYANCFARKVTLVPCGTVPTIYLLLVPQANTKQHKQMFLFFALVGTCWLAYKSLLTTSNKDIGIALHTLVLLRAKQ